MNLKETIQNDFTTAFKAKNEVKKSTLSMLKSEITKVEKSKGNVGLSDEDVLKVILSCVKQRKQSIEEFTKGNRMDLAEKEKSELIILETYLPKQMDTTQVKVLLAEILKDFINESNKNKKVGMIMGSFNKKYSGQFDNKELKSLVEEMVS